MLANRIRHEGGLGCASLVPLAASNVDGEQRHRGLGPPLGCWKAQREAAAEKLESEANGGFNPRVEAME